jgi:hypothetical protein
MINRTELVQTIANLVKNGINMDGYNLFECNLFMKELNDFINTETTLSSYYKNRKITVESIFFDPLLSIELEKTTIQCIPITDEGWLDAVFEVVKFMHVRAAKKREEERENLRKEAEANKEFDWI